MKKLIFALVFGGLLIFAVPEGQALVNFGLNTGGGGGGSEIFQGAGLEKGAIIARQNLAIGISKTRDAKKLLVRWTNFALGFIGLVAVVAVIWAGFLYLTAFGDDGRTESAKKILMWTAVGILLILGAYAIVKLLMEAVPTT